MNWPILFQARRSYNNNKVVHVKRLVIVAIIVALVVGIVGCVGGDGNNGGDSYTLIVDFTDGGTVTIDDFPIPGKALLTYDPGTIVNLAATPDAGYRFAEWTGNASTIDDEKAASTTIVIGDDYYVTANFIAQHTLTIDSTDGGHVPTPGEGTFTYDAVTVVNVVATADSGYHFVNWTGDVTAIANVTAAISSITMNSSYIITANFAVGLYFQADAAVWLSGPGTSVPEARSPRVLLQVLTNMVVDSVRVDLPGGGSVVLPRYTDAFSPGVDWTALFRFHSWVAGMPVAGAEYTFTGLDEGGEPVPGARDTDVWVGIEPPNPPINVRAELTEDGILVSWDEGPVIPGSFEPAARPQLGFYHFQVGSVEAWEVVYGAAGISASPHLIPRNKADFVEGKDFGLSLSELQDGTYRLVPRVISFAPQGSLGKGSEYNNHDPGQMITFTIEGGEISMG